MIEKDFVMDENYERDEDKTTSNSLIASMYTQMSGSTMAAGGIIVPFERD